VLEVLLVSVLFYLLLQPEILYNFFCENVEIFEKWLLFLAIFNVLVITISAGHLPLCISVTISLV